jgi:hypothetical protein
MEDASLPLQKPQQQQGEKEQEKGVSSDSPVAALQRDDWTTEMTDGKMPNSRFSSSFPADTGAMETGATTVEQASSSSQRCESAASAVAKQGEPVLAMSQETRLPTSTRPTKGRSARTPADVPPTSGRPSIKVGGGRTTAEDDEILPLRDSIIIRGNEANAANFLPDWSFMDMSTIHSSLVQETLMREQGINSREKKAT